MSFLDEWRDALPASYDAYAKLATTTEQELDFKYGLPAAAILEPASQPVKSFDPDAKQVIQQITKGNAVLSLLQSWHVDRLAAVRNLSSQAKQNDTLRAELEALLDQFNALPAFSQALARTMMAHKDTSANVYHVAEQIKAAMVNVGGEPKLIPENSHRRPGATDPTRRAGTRAEPLPTRE